MAAPNEDINLLPQEEWEKKPIGRLVKWTLTIGRYIVIATELIVITAFISRFKFDRDLSDLYEEIEIQQARIKSSEEFEKEFRLIQNRLKVIKELDKRKIDPSKILTSAADLIPLNVTLENLQFDRETGKLTFTGYSLSESGLAAFINNLKQSDYFNNIEIESIVKGSELQIDFKLNTSLSL